MTISGSLFDRVTKSVPRRVHTYFSTAMALECISTSENMGDLELLDLRYLTVIIGIGGSIGLLIAFSFPRELIEVLYRRFTADIVVPADEEDHYRREAAAEMTNIIIGNCTAEFRTPGERISISPPVVLEEARQIQRMKDAMFCRTSVVTEAGVLDVNFVGPKELFDSSLNYVS